MWIGAYSTRQWEDNGKTEQLASKLNFNSEMRRNVRVKIQEKTGLAWNHGVQFTIVQTFLCPKTLLN